MLQTISTEVTVKGDRKRKKQKRKTLLLDLITIGREVLVLDLSVSKQSYSWMDDSPVIGSFTNFGKLNSFVDSYMRRGKYTDVSIMERILH